MPAIMTHDFFGRDMLDRLPGGNELTEPERQAFLLGNQGPDPLFYLRVDPFRVEQSRLGNLMHGKKTNELLFLLKRSLSTLDPRDVPVGRAYAHGFLCHYLLDSSVHPLVYARQFALCDAGVEGLTRQDGSAVHAVIESELDQMVLYRKYQLTIADYSPHVQILRADSNVLRIAGLMYSFLLSHVYGKRVDSDLFEIAVLNFRFAQRVLYSPGGTKRAAVGKLEQLRYGHRYAVTSGMSHRAQAVEESWFGNPDHEVWQNPWTDAFDDRSFWDLYRDAQDRALQTIRLFEDAEFGEGDAEAIVCGVNFSGKPLSQVE